MSDSIKISNDFINNQNNNELIISLVGDIAFSNNVYDYINKNNSSLLFKNVSRIFKNSDISIGNLESPLYTKKALIPNKDVVLKGNPRAIEGLSKSGINIMSLANNHIVDCGKKGITETMRLLKENGINYSGVGNTKRDALKPLIIEKKRIKLRLISYSVYDVNLYKKFRSPYVSTGHPLDIIKEIKRAEKSCNLLIVSIHGGGEFHPIPKKSNIIDSRRFIDAGADIIFWHHPHVLRGYEIYKNKPIFYSLGNFIGDWTASFHPHNVKNRMKYQRKYNLEKWLRESLIVQIIVDKKDCLVKRINIHPAYISNNFSPEILTGTPDGEEIMNKIKDLSDRISKIEIDSKGNSKIIINKYLKQNKKNILSLLFEYLKLPMSEKINLFKNLLYK